MLQSSRIRFTSVGSTQGRKSRKNAHPVKSQPKIRKCVVKLTKLNLTTINKLVGNWAPSGTSTPKGSEKGVKKPVKLHQGETWDKSGLTNGILTAKDKTSRFRFDLPPKKPRVVVEDINRGYQTNGRIARKRKHPKQDDFIYFSQNDRSTKVTVEKTAKKIKKLKINSAKSSKRASKDNSNVKVKNCVVVLERLRLGEEIDPLSISEEENVESINVVPENNPFELQNGFESPVTVDPLASSSPQNENATPNIPKVVLIRDEMPQEPEYKEEVNDGESKDDILSLRDAEIPNVASAGANAARQPNPNSPMEYSESWNPPQEQVPTCSGAPISISAYTAAASESAIFTPMKTKSILSPDRSRNGNISNTPKKVSFSEYHEMIYFEPEEVESTTPEVPNEIIELGDLADYLADNARQMEDEEDSYEDDNQDEVNKVINEIISQHV